MGVGRLWACSYVSDERRLWCGKVVDIFNDLQWRGRERCLATPTGQTTGSLGGDGDRRLVTPTGQKTGSLDWDWGRRLVTPTCRKTGSLGGDGGRRLVTPTGRTFGSIAEDGGRRYPYRSDDLQFR